MTRPISRPIHIVIDYLYAVVVAALPFVVGFESLPARIAAWGLAATVLVVTLFTRAEGGVWRRIPFRVHLALDVTGGVAAIAAPWLLGFSGETGTRNVFLLVGVLALVVTALTRPGEMGDIRAANGSGIV